MTEVPLAVYNPDLLGREETIAWFSARKGLLERILDDLRHIGPKERPQHYLLIGQRGMGKTSLLRRLRYAIADDKALARQWLAITFPEEQYNVSRLSDLWVNCLDALSDAFEEDGRHAEAAALDEAIEHLPGDEEERSRAAIALLVRMARKRGGGLVLLLDSVDLLFDRLPAADHWVIRKVLTENPLVFVGASSAFIDETHEYGSAFYDFFKVEELRGLEEPEARELLRNIARLRNAPRIAEILDRDPGRISALRVLTGGNPRNLVLVASVLASEETSTVERDLTALLDLSTPLFKARFEGFAPQAQVIVDALALHWHPAPASAIAETTRLDVAVVSAQLDRLCKHGIVEKVELPDRKRMGFQVAERLFNIWYLMRASRRTRKRLGWLVEFLRLFYGSDALEQRARRTLRDAAEGDFLEQRHRAELAFAYAEAVRSPALKAALERCALYLLTDPREEARKKLAEVLDLEGEDRHLAPAVDHIVAVREIERAVRSTNIRAKSWDADTFSKLLTGSLALTLVEKQRIASELGAMSAQRRSAVVKALKEQHQGFEARGIPVSAVSEAIRRGLMKDLTDVEGACIASEQLDAPILAAALGARLRQPATAAELESFAEWLPGVHEPAVWKLWLDAAKNAGANGQAYVAALGHSQLSSAGFLAIAKGLSREDPMRETILRRALALASNNAELWLQLGIAIAPRDPQSAADAIRRCLDLEPTNAHAWAMLGAISLHFFASYPATEDACRRAIEYERDHSVAWVILGEVLAVHLDRPEEGERAVRRALQLAPRDPLAWTGLGNVLAAQKGHEPEAEAAYNRAIKLAPTDVYPRLRLALFLDHFPDRAKDVITSWQRIAELDPTQRGNLAWRLFAYDKDLPLAEEHARAAVAAEPNSPHEAFTLACILTRTGAWSEAALLAKRFLGAQSPPWKLVEVFFGEAYCAGYAREAITLLDQQHLDDRLQPLRAAIEATWKGADSLLAFAPEVREPAEKILHRFTGIRPEKAEPRTDEARRASTRKQVKELPGGPGRGSRRGRPSRRRS